jgi:hypothetical protein
MAVILCIDDSENGLAVRKLLLETQGHRVLTALTGSWVGVARWVGLDDNSLVSGLPSREST